MEMLTGMLMEETKKYTAEDEAAADLLIAKVTEETSGMIMDVKKTYKEFKNKGEFYVVTIKIRYKTLDDAKESFLNG